LEINHIQDLTYNPKQQGKNTESVICKYSGIFWKVCQYAGLYKYYSKSTHRLHLHSWVPVLQIWGPTLSTPKFNCCCLFIAQHMDSYSLFSAWPGTNAASTSVMQRYNILNRRLRLQCFYSCYFNFLVVLTSSFCCHDTYMCRKPPQAAL
jgi:hypothetical protein